MSMFMSMGPFPLSTFRRALYLALSLRIRIQIGFGQSRSPNAALLIS